MSKRSRYFKMAAAAILDFWNLNILTVGTVKKVELHHCAKFHRNRSNRAEICEFQYYASLAWKCLFTPLLGVFGGTFPQMMSLIVLTPKGPFLGWTTSFEPKTAIFSNWFLNGPYKSPLFPIGLTLRGPQKWVFGCFKYGGVKYFKSKWPIAISVRRSICWHNFMQIGSVVWEE